MNPGLCVQNRSRVSTAGGGVAGAKAGIMHVGAAVAPQPQPDQGSLEAQLVGRPPGQLWNCGTSRLRRAGRVGVCLLWGWRGARQVVSMWQLLPKPAHKHRAFN